MGGLVPAVLATASYTSDVNGDTPIPFGVEIDPHNILSDALSNEFVHLSENKVEYYEVQQGPDNVLK